MGEIHFTLHIQKQQQNHNFRSEKPSSFLIESTWSYHLIGSEIGRGSLKENTEIRKIVILSDDKYTISLSFLKSQ